MTTAIQIIRRIEKIRAEKKKIPQSLRLTADIVRRLQECQNALADANMEIGRLRQFKAVVYGAWQASFLNVAK